MIINGRKRTEICRILLSLYTDTCEDFVFSSLKLRINAHCCYHNDQSPIKAVLEVLTSKYWRLHQYIAQLLLFCVCGVSQVRDCSNYAISIFSEDININIFFVVLKVILVEKKLLNMSVVLVSCKKLSKNDLFQRIIPKCLRFLAFIYCKSWSSIQMGWVLNQNIKAILIKIFFNFSHPL